MASLVQRRRSSSGSNSPRIVIPPHKDEELDSEVYIASPQSGNLSPDLKPNTPPVLPSGSQNNRVLQIGKYLLVELIDHCVYTAVNIHTREEKICKVFTKENYRSKTAAYCRLYGSCSVAAISEIIHGDQMVYVFFDKNYGDLHSYVRSKRHLGEEEAILLFRQIAAAVAHCHDCGVIIRDLKLRKFVFTNPERTRIQLEGLEDSHVLDEDDDDTLRDKQGCPAYVSPEILESAHCGYSGRASDQWSSGVMLYTMLIGRYPFHEQEPAKLFERIKLGNFSIPSRASAKAKCLIRNLLRRDASERLTAQEVLQHPWLCTASGKMVTSKDYFSDQMVPSL